MLESGVASACHLLPLRRLGPSPLPVWRFGCACRVSKMPKRLLIKDGHQCVLQRVAGCLRLRNGAVAGIERLSIEVYNQILAAVQQKSGPTD